MIAKHGNIPLASNDGAVHSLCRREGVGCFTLPRILRFAISKKVITREEARQIVILIEREERTLFKGKDEVFK